MSLLAQGLDVWHEWVNSGALAAFAVFVCWLVSRLATHGGKKALELGERYVRTTENLHDTLRKSDSERTKLCQQHAVALENTGIAVADSNKHLERLVQIHEMPGGIVHDAADSIAQGSVDLQRMKQVALQACRMCREISEKELPDSASRVKAHCDEIERIIESGDE